MVMFLIQSLIKNSAGLGLVQPLGMVRGTSVGEQRGTGEETFSVKAGARQCFLFSLMHEPGKLSLRLTFSIESLNPNNLNRG